MARVVRILEYLGTPEQLKVWLQHSCADGVSPMFGPERQLIVATIESDVTDIEAGKHRPLVRYEGIENRMKWVEENQALEQILTRHLRRWPNEEYNEAAQRVLDRVRQILATETQLGKDARR